MLPAPRIALVVCCLLFSMPVAAQEWTRFRGPNGSGVSTAKTVPTTWTADDFNWVAELPGVGHSSPVVWGDLVFVTSADKQRATRHFVAVDANSGKTRWQVELSFETYKHHKNNSSASNTPAVDADHVYFLQQSRAASPLAAYDHTGKKVWEYDLGPYLHGQGGGTSPIVYNDMVIVANDHSNGSFLLAVDRMTGKEIWKVPRAGKRACYSTPCIYQPSGQPAEIIFTHSFEGIVGADPRSGRQKWMIEVFGTFAQRAVGSPVVAGDLVLGASGARFGDKNVVAVRPGYQGDQIAVEEVFRLTKPAPHVPTPLVYGDWLFLWNDMGIVTCADAKTGDVVWQKRVGGNFMSSPICIDGKLYGVELDGEVIVLAASDKYEMLARNPLGKPSRATPAVSGGALFLRTYSHLFAIGGKTGE